MLGDNEIAFCAPSYKRHDGCFTQQTYPFVQYVVAESESDSYIKNGHKVIIAPDSAQGNLCRIRNWILDNIESKRIILLDDDIKAICRYQNQKAKKLNADEFMEFCEMAYVMADDLDIKYWGLNCLPDKGAYREYTPFCMRAYIGGPFQAFNGMKDLRYDEKIFLKEDYDMTLQVLAKYKRVLRFNAYHYVAKQHTNKGGCADYRTIEREKQHNAMLQQKWGTKIVQMDKSGNKNGYDINPIIKIPGSGV